MADVFTKEKRSEIMSKIRSGNTKPEMIVRRHLHKNGFRYAIHSKKLPGSPDIVLVSRKIAIFINGCFWHGHKDCFYSKLPISNADFWRNKISTNVLRDAKNHKLIRGLGYKVLTVWQCQLKGKVRDRTLRELVRKIEKYKSKY